MHIINEYKKMVLGMRIEPFLLVSVTKNYKCQFLEKQEGNKQKYSIK